MNYTVAGQDGKTYGPVSAAQIRAWIAQSRVDARTPVFITGAADWTYLGLLPEFAVEFSSPPSVIAPLKPGAKQPLKNNPLATWGLICGLLAWTFCCCCIPFNLLGLVFSIIALVQINAHPDTQDGRALAIAGLVLSATNLAWCFGLTLFDFAASQPNFQFNLGQH
jgi:hypothetical protein